MSQSQHDSQNRRPWVAPHVQDVGGVRKITRGPDGGTFDALIGGTGGFEDGGPDIPMT